MKMKQDYHTHKGGVTFLSSVCKVTLATNYRRCSLSIEFPYTAELIEIPITNEEHDRLETSMESNLNRMGPLK